MTEKLRLGLIGLGEIAYKSTGHVLARCANAEAVAGVDPVPETATP